jgi:hypothetical protein
VRNAIKRQETGERASGKNNATYYNDLIKKLEAIKKP